MPGTSHYLIALGSNLRHHRYGAPPQVLKAAIAALDAEGLEICEVSPIIRSAPVGPSQRQYANAAMVVEANASPPGMLHLLKRMERQFGRRAGGQRWRARLLDLDIVLWSGGCFAAPGLVIPHPLFRKRGFVLGPAAAIAGDWRDPITGLTVRQLDARLTRPMPLPS